MEFNPIELTKIKDAWRFAILYYRKEGSAGRGLIKISIQKTNDIYFCTSNPTDKKHSGLFINIGFLWLNLPEIKWKTS